MRPASEPNDRERYEATDAERDGVTPAAPAPARIAVEDIRGDVVALPIRLATDIAEWLDWQSRMIHGVHVGTVFLAPRAAKEPLRLAARWPARGVEHAALANAASRSLRTGEIVAGKAFGEGSVVRDHLAHPVRVRGRVVASVALAMSVRSDEQRHAVTQLQIWCSVWLEKLLEPLVSGHHDAESLRHEALVSVSRGLPLPLALNTLSTLLAERLRCTGVAVGLCRGLQVRTCAMSHQIGFDRRTARLRELENAMEECVDRRGPVVSPTVADDEPGAIVHSQLLARHGIGAVCSVPLRVGERIVGVLSFMRDVEPFDGSTRDELAALADCLAPSIHRLRRLERPFGALRTRLEESAAGRGDGRGRLGRRSIVALGLAILAALSLVRVDHRVSATSVVEGSFQQAIAAPFPGRLAAVHARAGDRVESGAVLVELDDAELRLERDKWRGERDRQEKEYQLALASRDRAQVVMNAARLAQSEAELKLVESRLAQTRLKAPFTGMLVSGDWSQALGSPVDTGELLFEVVPLAGFRLIIEVDERDVARVSVGQQGVVRLAGLPSRPLAVTVADILPIATAHDGGNYFRVEAEVQDPPEALRPGMRGVAKIVVGRASLARVWFGELVERLRIWAWSLGA